MKLIKMRFPDLQARATGIAAITRRGRVICLPDQTFIVPAPALEFLDQVGLAYDVLAEEGWDSAVRTLRDSAAAALQ